MAVILAFDSLAQIHQDHHILLKNRFINLKGMLLKTFNGKIAQFTVVKLAFCKIHHHGNHHPLIMAFIAIRMTFGILSETLTGT